MHATNLEVWKKAMVLVKDVYVATKTMPSDEKYGLTSQIRRAVVSIPVNLSEGYGRRQTNDRRRYVEIAMGSTSEVQCLLQIIGELELMSSDEMSELSKKAEEVARMLNGLYTSFDRNPS